jgi:prepilin-type N-terminal cleavage/methylation domain-containing protein
MHATAKKSGRSNRGEAGFTLVEMIVAIALFAVVMLVAVGALLSLTGANRKAQALQSVMNNLNIALDGMVRNLRMGTSYHCGAGTFVGDGTSDDCSAGSTLFSFKPFCDPSSCNPASESTWVYQFVAPQGSATGYIARSEDGGNTWVHLTAPEVSINSMTFYVVGSKPGDTTQPKVLVVLKGEAGIGSAKTDTTFHVEATAVQRQLDLH